MHTPPKWFSIYCDQYVNLDKLCIIGGLFLHSRQTGRFVNKQVFVVRIENCVNAINENVPKRLEQKSEARQSTKRYLLISRPVRANESAALRDYFALRLLQWPYPRSRLVKLVARPIPPLDASPNWSPQIHTLCGASLSELASKRACADVC